MFNEHFFKLVPMGLMIDKAFLIKFILYTASIRLF